jgi:pyridoxamine 5'-phosphate oxidase
MTAATPAVPPIDPIREFLTLRAQVGPGEFEDGTAAVLATADASGRPSVRTVLVKHVDERGFAFFTNYGSRKARELDANPRAALCFFWPSAHRQVVVDGRVTRVVEAESDAYFAGRPRGSQLAAWASRQSAPLDTRAELEASFREHETRFRGQPVARPPFWGGYRLAPERIEFWRGIESRMHERRLYQRGAEGWSEALLYP